MGQNRGNAIEDPQKIEYRLISAKPDLLYPGRVARRAMGRAGEGNAEGSPTGLQHPVRWKTSIGDAMNGVPAAAHVKLAGRAVDRGGRLSALFRGTAAVCTAHRGLRRHGRRVRRQVIYDFHLIGNYR